MSINVFETVKETVEEIKETKSEVQSYSSFTTLYKNVPSLNKMKDTIKYREYLKRHGYDLKKVINQVVQYNVYLSMKEPFSNEPLYVAPKGVLFEDLGVKFVRDTTGVTKELLDIFCSSVLFESENVLIIPLDDMFFDLDRKVQEFVVLNKLAMLILTDFNNDIEKEDYLRQLKYGYTPLLVYVADYLTSLSMENSDDALTSLYTLYCQTRNPSYRERYFNLTNILVGEELKSGSAYETLLDYINVYCKAIGKETPKEAYKFDYQLSHVNIQANLQSLNEVMKDVTEVKEESPKEEVKKHGGLDALIPEKKSSPTKETTSEVDKEDEDEKEPKKEDAVEEKKSAISKAVELHDTLVDDAVSDVKPTTPTKKRTTTRKRTTTTKSKKTEDTKPEEDK